VEILPLNFTYLFNYAKENLGKPSFESQTSRNHPSKS